MNYLNQKDLEVLSGEQTIRLIKNANDALRNSRSSGIMQRLDDIVKLVILKIYDEIEVESGVKCEYEFQISNEDDVDSVYMRLLDLFKRNINSPNFCDLYPESQKKLSTDREGIYNISKIWGSYKFKESFEDIKGAAFQEILKNTFDKNENQQFFTPSECAEFMAKLGLELINRKGLMKISACDPAIGTGGLLLQLSKLSNSFNENFQIEYFGSDYDEKMAWLSAINIYLSTQQHGKIAWANCIGGSLNKEESFIESELFDLILSNPPFGSDITNDEVLKQYNLGDKNSRRRSILFMERNLELLKPGGILVMVIDESVLNSEKTIDVRKYIRNSAKLKAVFSLPDGAFLPYATVKTSIVVLEKVLNHEVDNYESTLFYEIVNTGRKPNGDIDYVKNNLGEKNVNNDFEGAFDVFKDYLSNKELDSTSKKFTLVNKVDFISSAKENRLSDWKASRMDMLPYHPIVKLSNKALNKAENIILLKEVVSIRSERVNSFNFPNEVFKYIGLANMEKETGVIEVEEVFGDDIKSTCNKFYLGDIIFARMRPELRKVAVIGSDVKEGICSSECAVMYINEKYSERISADYLAWIFRSDLFYGQVIGKVTGIGRPRISSNSLLNCKIPLPSLEMQKNITNKLESAKGRLIDVRAEVQKMYDQIEKEYRNSFEVIDELLVYNALK